jgi:hypothetical protein
MTRPGGPNAKEQLIIELLNRFPDNVRKAIFKEILNNGSVIIPRADGTKTIILYGQ